VQSFGQRLQKEREKQGVTLDEVCASTKVAVRFLRAIEEERFDQLPGGIFNKGFVRSYAQHLGINEQEAVDDYMLAAGLVTPPVPEEIAVPSDTKAPETKSVEPKPVEVRKPEVKAPDAKKPEAKPPLAANPPVIETKPAKIKVKHAARQKQHAEEKKEPKPAPLPLPEVETSRGDWFPWGKLAFVLLLIAFGFAMWGSFHTPSEEHTSQPAPKPSINQSIGTPEPKPLQNVSADMPALALPQPETAPLAAQAALRSPEPSTAGSFVVVVEAHEAAWVSIKVDGKEIMQDVLSPSAQKSFEAHKEVVIKAGNVGALDFRFNGKKLPAQGDYDEVKVLTFDPNGLQSQPVKAAGL
jgi:transcriptional regulator with XRE-family HTH domain